MRMSESLTGVLKYMKYLKRQASVAYTDNLIAADLHAHPYITDTTTLTKTLSVLKQNRIGILGLTSHGAGNSKEFSYWSVRKMLQCCESPVVVSDMDIVMQLEYQGHTTTLISAVEDYCLVDGICGKLNLIFLASDNGLQDTVTRYETLADKLKIAADFNAIVISSHPYTLWDPHGPFGVLKFRLASSRERAILQDQVFPIIDGVDCVATNVLWMVQSNDLLLKDYSGTPLFCSDTHAVSEGIRKQIGKTGTFFPAFSFDSGIECRQKLKELLHKGCFYGYMNYFGPIHFIQSIVMEKPSKFYP